MCLLAYTICQWWWKFDGFYNLLLFITCIRVLWYFLFITAVFKIFKLSPDQFEVVHNLRDLPHKHINLNYSSNDVQWNPRDGENVSVGIIILWADQQNCLTNQSQTASTWTFQQCFSKELPILVTFYGCFLKWNIFTYGIELFFRHPTYMYVLYSLWSMY